MTADGAASGADGAAPGFVARHGLWGEAQHGAAQQAERVIDELGLELIRLSFADQHGVLRGKTLTVPAYEWANRSGHGVPSTLVLKDTSHRTVFPVFTRGAGLDLPQFAGVADIVMVPDPTTFRVLPWAPRTGWVLCDLYHPDGSAVRFSTRRVLRAVLDDLAARGYNLVTGLEVEFHVFRLDDDHLSFEAAGQPAEPPAVSLLSHGYQLMTDDRLDRLDGVVQLLREGLAALDLGVRSFELEFGPGQLEVTFAPQTGLRAADDMVLFRSAVKQLCRRNGLHATFMCRPALANVFSSGWHLHQSLVERPSGRNAFASDEPGALLSPLARAYVAGLLAHADAASVFTTPTVNGYKRYRPYSLAPDRRVWGVDNKAAMIRAVGVPGDPATHLENRAGEPAANPYLYLASQVVAGLDGIDRGLDPGPPCDEPYAAEAERLPTTLLAAVDALRADPVFAERLGNDVVDWLLTIKRAELDRYLAAVSDWEHREYFDLF